MNDELLAYYNRELAFIRKLGAEFSQAYPKVAGRLAWAEEGSADPHVSRMIEAFALLAARTRHKIDDGFPEITEAMLGILYPHYLSPTPSCAIIQTRIDRSQAQLTAGYNVPRGTAVNSEPIQGLACQFQTCYDLQLWPVEPSAANYQVQPIAAPPTRFSGDVEGVIRIQLKTLSTEVKFAQMDLGKLRFHIVADGQYAYDLYELIFNNCLGVALAAGPDDANAVSLGRNAIQPVGFEQDQGLLDYSPQSFLGYRLLTEFFTFPQKFLFFDIDGLDARTLRRVGTTDKLELFIYVNRLQPELQQQVSTETFRLGCVPMVNLYRQRAEPIRCKHTSHEHRIVPDARRPAHHEVFRVQRVVGTSPRNEQIEFAPFYSTRHGNLPQPRAFWHTSRRARGYAGGQMDRGTEVYLSLVDLDFQPADVTDWTIDVETLCVSRDLPSQLPFGGGQPNLQLGAGASLTRIECLTRPTPTHRPSLREQTMWRLVSHLSLNHLSLVNNERGAEGLREILRLYDPANSDVTRALIEGLQDVSARRIVGRVGGPVAAGFCRGMEITLELDEEKYSGSGVYLFSSVLERFFGLYASLNSFTKTIVKTNRRPHLCSWPPRAGEQVLI